MNWYIEVIKKYAVFSGRASRKEYWTFFLINAIISMAIKYLEKMLGLSMVELSPNLNVGIFHAIYLLWIFIPSIAVMVRRLHDIDRKGEWVFIAILPIIGWIWVFILVAKEGDVAENKYGPVPSTI